MVSSIPPGIRYVYFYYVTPGDGGHPTVNALLHKSASPITDIEKVIKALVKDAVDDKIDWDAHGTGGLIWRRKSYIAVALEDGNHHFVDNRGLIIEDGYESFEEVSFFEIDVKDSSSRTRHLEVNYCFNHVRKKGDGEWGDRPDTYMVLLRPTPPYMRNHEDTGQNLGPPVPPP